MENRKNQRSVVKVKEEGSPRPPICLLKLNHMLNNLPAIKREKSLPTQLLAPNPGTTKLKRQTPLEVCSSLT